MMAKAALFYADNGMVLSTYPGWLQLAFDTLKGVFDRVGLQTNVHKTVGVVCRPCRPARVRVDNQRGRAELKGETSGTGAINGVREGGGKGVTSGAPPNPARRGER